MTILLFTAEASLYRSRGNYSTTWLEGSGPAEANAIVPAYYPGSDTQRQCNSCIAAVVRDGTLCHATATAVVAAICAGSGWFTFGISCAVAVGGLGVAFLGCDAAWGSALAYCSAEECCPKRCGGVPNPLDPGHGCCDSDESCRPAQSSEAPAAMSHPVTISVSLGKPYPRGSTLVHA
jgi:hypothetical protein